MEGYVQYTATTLSISTYKVGKVLRLSRFYGGTPVSVAIKPFDTPSGYKSPCLPLILIMSPLAVLPAPIGSIGWTFSLTRFDP